MNINKFSKSESGDTIVEVMIAILVACVVLVAAYASTNHNTQSMQNAQEHSQALKLVETQIEFMRNHGGSPAPTGTCFDSSGTPASGIHCKVDGSGGESVSIAAYTLKIVGGVYGTYQVSAVFDNVFGKGKDNVTVLYRPEGL